MNEAFKGNVIPDKTIVCGHWHCSYGWARKEYEKSHDYSKYKELVEDNPRWDIFEMPGIFAIDRCTALTEDINVLILEDELIEKA